MNEFMTTSEDLYTIAQSIVSGGSGRGNSYFETAANCGHQRLLLDQLGKRQDGPLPDWAVRGTNMHLLLQWWQDGRIPSGQAMQVREDDQYWSEAVTLFQWFTETYEKDTFGTCVGTEVQFPANAAEQQLLADWLGIPFEWCATGRADMRSVVSEEQCERLATVHGVLLPGPGKYLVDWKHGKSHNAQDADKFTQGVQPVWYLTADRILHPEDPARGMIFPKVSMTMEKGKLKKKDTSFKIHVATWEPSFPHRARQMIRFAYEQMMRDVYNPYSCAECPFFQKECSGFDPNLVQIRNTQPSF